MKQANVVAFLKGLGCKVPASQPRAGWVVSSCAWAPWNHAQGKSAADVFGVKSQSGDPLCNCFSCGWHGSALDLIMEMRARNKLEPLISAQWGEMLKLVEQAESESVLDLDGPDYEELLAAKREPLHAFPEWWLDSFPPVAEYAAARDYLAQRDVAPDTAEQLDLRFDSKQRRICFPLRDFAGQLVGLHGRAISANVEPRYRMYLQAGKNNPICWLGESWVDTNKPIVVVEGPFDLASVKRVYANTVSPLFVNPSIGKLKRMADALTWVTFFDRGKGGDSGRAKISQALGQTHVIHHLIPPAHRKDPGEMSEDELLDALAKVD